MKPLDPEFVFSVREQLNYDPETGLLTRKRGPKAGREAGGRDSKGHIQVRLNGRLYLAHRLIWVILYGRWPVDEVDHRNRIRDDNRLANLRECTHAQNSKNNNLYATNSTGIRGVSVAPRTGKFMAYINVNGKRHALGHYPDIEQARAARLAAERRYFGEFAAP